VASFSKRTLLDAVWIITVMYRLWWGEKRMVNIELWYISFRIYCLEQRIIRKSVLPNVSNMRMLFILYYKLTIATSLASIFHVICPAHHKLPDFTILRTPGDLYKSHYSFHSSNILTVHYLYYHELTLNLPYGVKFRQGAEVTWLHTWLGNQQNAVHHRCNATFNSILS
jgi:hypothetical protein